MMKKLVVMLGKLKGKKQEPTDIRTIVDKMVDDGLKLLDGRTSRIDYRRYKDENC